MTDQQQSFHLQSTWENLLIGLLHDWHLMNMEQKYNLIEVGDSGWFFWVLGECWWNSTPLAWFSNHRDAPGQTHHHHHQLLSVWLLFIATAPHTARLDGATYDRYDFYYPTRLLNIQQMSIKHLLRTRRCQVWARQYRSCCHEVHRSGGEMDINKHLGIYSWFNYEKREKLFEYPMGTWTYQSLPPTLKLASPQKSSS